METKFAIVWRGKSGNQWNLTPELYPTREIAEYAVKVQDAIAPTLLHTIIPVELPAVAHV